MNIIELLTQHGFEPKALAAAGEYVCRCPFHNDKKPSLSVNADKEVYHCKACNASGNIKTLAKELGVQLDPNYKPPPQKKTVKKPVDNLHGFDADAPTEHPTLKKPTAFWDYANFSGFIYARVFRFDVADGGKEIRPLIKTDGGYKWAAPPDAFRGLYRLDKLGKKIVFCEGEKAADAAQQIMHGKGWEATTWLGGANTDHKTKIEAACRDADIILWADNDAAGKKCMQRIAERLKGVAKSVRWVAVREDAVAGYDAADALANGDKPTIVASADAKPPKDKPIAQGGNAVSPYLLGYDGGNAFVWSRASNCAVAIKLGYSGIKDKLPVIAPSEFWQTEFPEKKGGINYGDAVDWVIKGCYAAGWFDERKIKGRGIHCDADGIVLNTGTHLISGSGTIPLSQQARQGAIYRAGKSMDAGLTENLSADDVRELYYAMRRLGWASQDMSIYLLGWIAHACICGANRWRAHMWISAAAGAGKTWVMDNIIRPLLPTAIYATAKTTEAGLRRVLQSDALPVVIDEAETTNKGDNENLQQILGLAKQASSNDGAVVIKGKAGGGGGVDIWTVRSTFLFSSINFGVVDAADMSRFIHLRLRVGALKDEEFLDLAKDITQLIDKRFIAAFFTRAFNNVERILVLQERISSILSVQLRGKREGDTYGTILAAAHAMLGDDDSDAAVNKTLAHCDFIDGGVYHKFDADAELILETLLGKVIKIDSKDFTMRELIKGQHATEMKERLALFGIVQRGSELYISHNINITQKIFDNTPWKNSWHFTLAQHFAAKQRSEGSVRFGKTFSRTYLVFEVASLITEIH